MLAISSKLTSLLVTPTLNRNGDVSTVYRPFECKFPLLAKMHVPLLTQRATSSPRNIKKSILSQPRHMQSAVKMRSEKTETPDDGEDDWCHDAPHAFTFGQMQQDVACSLAAIPVPIHLDTSIDLMMLDADAPSLHFQNMLCMYALFEWS